MRDHNIKNNDTAAEIIIPGLPTYYGGKQNSGVYQTIIN